MSTIACGFSNIWFQVRPAPAYPNMITYFMWQLSGPYWKYVRKTTNILREYPSA